MNIDRIKLKDKLEEILKRKASDAEIENAKTDINILIEILFDEIEAIKKRLP